MKQKKISSQLQHYVTENLRERGIAYELEDRGAYSVNPSLMIVLRSFFLLKILYEIFCKNPT